MSHWGVIKVQVLRLIFYYYTEYWRKIVSVLSSRVDMLLFD